jgi:hypothetical protein
MNFAINTSTGDLVDTDDWFAEDDSSAPAVYCQLTHEYNQWPGDKDAGSRFAVMMRNDEVDDGPAGQEALVIELKRCLGVLVDGRIIADVQARATRDGSGRVRIDDSYRDLASGKVVNDYLDDFGG